MVWYERQISDDPRLHELLSIAGEHRSLYESLEVESCYGSTQLGLYSQSCLQNDDDLKGFLFQFWETQSLEALKSKKYAESRLARSDETFPLRGSEELAFDISIELIYFPEVLRLISPVDSE
jgi:hypothetical protein